jgi:hypothetical protein
MNPKRKGVPYFPELPPLGESTGVLMIRQAFKELGKRNLRRRGR